MARISPLNPLHIQAGAALRPYGPEDAGIELVEAFDYVEAEYAAIRKHCAVLDQPHRGTLIVTGPERLAFLHRMVTQDTKTMQPGDVRRGFWLNRKGRIDADLRMIELGDRMVIDVDAHNTASSAASLGGYIITEACEIKDESESWHRLAVHGPGARALVARWCEGPSADTVMRLEPNRACVATILGREVVIDRQDVTGEVGIELLLPADHAVQVYQAMAAPLDASARLAGGMAGAGTGWKPDPEGRARRVGWHAFNIARIEGGTPLFNIDFGPDSLPHETGVLKDRVSFTKGCYLGQEVVARMDALGAPKRKLVALRFEQSGTSSGKLPSAGAAIMSAVEPVDGAQRDIIGGVTSSTIGPLVGAEPIAFAMQKTKFATPGTKVLVEAEGELVVGVTQESLRFLKR